MVRNKYADSATIRLENVGCIIWSPLKKRYFSLSTKYQELFNSYLLDGFCISDIFKRIPEIEEDLKEIGVDDSVQIVNNIKRKNRALYAPLEYYFDFTSNCNLKCNGCYNIDTWGNVCMHPSTIKAIINEMLELGIRRVYLAGGEPLTNMEATRIYLDTCYQNGITSSIATNGTMLTDEICEFLLTKNLFDISISLDCWDNDTSLRIRGRGGFEDAVDGIKRLVRIKSRMKSETEICIKPIIDRELSDVFYKKMVQLAIELKVDKLKLINPERSLNHPRGYYGRNVKKYYEMNMLISELQKQYKDVLTITNGSNPCNGFGHIGIKGLDGCIGGQELLAINPDGRISPCLMDHTLLGNYYDFGSIKRFLDDSCELENYQKNKNQVNCHLCNIYTRCRGGCQVRKIVQTGTQCGKDPLCPIYNEVPISSDIDEYSNVLDMIICAHSL